jgi:IS605 OrfB family transposase
MSGVQQSALVHRTARVGVRSTRAQADRLYGLLRDAGDVWAALVDLNRDRQQRQAPPEVNFQALCRQLTGVDVGGLSRQCAEGVLRRYTDAWHETARRKRRGEGARYPRRKRRLAPVRWRYGGFRVAGDGRRVRLGVARGQARLDVRLAQPIPYPVAAVRSVTLVADAGRLWLDVTAAVPVADHGLDPDRVAGVDIGLIHPYAVAGPDGQGLLVSGRALRAKARLHLEDTKRRSSATGRRAPKPGAKASRRWRQHRAAQRKVERRHRRRVRQAHHEAAGEVVAWAVTQRVGTIRVGDLATILEAPAGSAQRWRTREWRHGHLLDVLRDKAAAAGIAVEIVDERGTSSTCPQCGARHKAHGRRFVCGTCGVSGHRDLVGAANIARRSAGGAPGADPPSPADTTTVLPVVVKHRRAGTHLPGLGPARRDRRRHLWDNRRRRTAVLPGSGPPPPIMGESHAPPRVVVDRTLSAAPHRAKTATDH